MKKLFVFLFFFVAGNIFSDMTIVQKMESSGMMGQPPQKGNVTMYLKGPKMKVDIGEGMSQIVDIDSGKMFIINPVQKTVMTATVDQMKQYAGMMGQQGGASAQKTGNSKNVNGYPCEEYKITTSGMVSSETIACVSDKIEAAEFEKFRKFAEDLKFGALPPDVKGYPVLSDTKMSIMGQNMTSHSEIVSVSYDAIPDSVFAIPSDYKTTEMPQMPKMG
jgi:hypothetical protein